MNAAINPQINPTLAPPVPGRRWGSDPERSELPCGWQQAWGRRGPAPATAPRPGSPRSRRATCCSATATTCACRQLFQHGIRFDASLCFTGQGR